MDSTSRSRCEKCSILTTSCWPVEVLYQPNISSTFTGLFQCVPQVQTHDRLLLRSTSGFTRIHQQDTTQPRPAYIPRCCGYISLRPSTAVTKRFDPSTVGRTFKLCSQVQLNHGSITIDWLSLRKVGYSCSFLIKSYIRDHAVADPFWQEPSRLEQKFFRRRERFVPLQCAWLVSEV